MTTFYRLLTADDETAFSHKVSEALSRGWALHGSSDYSWDHRQNLMRCAQAVTKDIDIPYTHTLKLHTL